MNAVNKTPPNGFIRFLRRLLAVIGAGSLFLLIFGELFDVFNKSPLLIHYAICMVLIVMDFDQLAGLMLKLAETLILKIRGKS